LRIVAKKTNRTKLKPHAGNHGKSGNREVVEKAKTLLAKRVQRMSKWG
jgi:hypothetical protein